MEPFAVQCPSCHARLQIADEKLVGKQVPCPQCKALIAIQAPHSEQGVSFSRVLEALEEEQAAKKVASAPPESGPAFLQDMAVAYVGRSRNTSDWKIPALLGGGIAVVIVLMILVWFASDAQTKQPDAEISGTPVVQTPPAKRTTPPIAPKPPEPAVSAPQTVDLAYVPENAEFIMVTRVAKLWEAPLVQKLIALGPMEFVEPIEQLTKAAGLKLADIESMVFAAISVSEAAKEAQDLLPIPGVPGEEDEATPGGNDEPAAAVNVIRTTKAVDREGLIASALNSEVIQHLGKTYYRVTFEQAPEPISVYFPDDRTIVFATDEVLKAAISRGPDSAPMRRELEALDPRCQIAITLLPSPESLRAFHASRASDDEQDEETEPVWTLLEEHGTGLTLGLQLSETLTAQAILSCKTPQIGTELSRLMQEKIQETRAGLPEFTDMLPRLLGRILEQALDSLKAKPHDFGLELTGTVPASLFETETLQMLPATFMTIAMMGGFGDDEDPGLGMLSPDEPEPSDDTSPSYTRLRKSGRNAANDFGVGDEFDQRLTLSFEKPFGVFAPHDAKLLFVKLEIGGKQAAQATHYGFVRVQSAKDDMGNALKVVTSLFEDPSSEWIELDHRSSDSNEPLKIHMMLDRPSPSATQLALLNGSLKLKLSVGRKIVTIPTVLQKVGTTLSTPELKQARLRLKIEKPDKDDVEDPAKAISVVIRGSTEKLLEMQLANGKDQSINTSRSRFTFNQVTTYTFEADRRLGRDTKLKITLSSGQNVQTIPFHFDNVPLAVRKQQNPLRQTPPRPRLQRQRVQLEKPAGESGPFNAFAFSPDGQTVAGGSGDEVILWNIRTGELTKSLGKHRATVTWLKFSRDGETLASASQNDGWIRLWHMPSGKPKKSILLTGKYATTSIHFPLLILSPDGSTLVTVDERVIKHGETSMTSTEAGKLTVWNTQTSKEKWSVTDSYLKALALSADGKTLAGLVQVKHWKVTSRAIRGETGERHLVLWDLETGQVQQKFDPGLSFAPVVMAFLGGSQSLIGMSGHRSVMLDIRNRQITELYRDRSFSVARAFALSSNDRTLVQVNNKYLKLWDLTTGKRISQVTLSREGPLSYPAFTPDLRFLACMRKGEPTIIAMSSLTGSERVGRDTKNRRGN